MNSTREWCMPARTMGNKVEKKRVQTEEYKSKEDSDMVAIEPFMGNNSKTIKMGCERERACVCFESNHDKEQIDLRLVVVVVAYRCVRRLVGWFGLFFIFA